MNIDQINELLENLYPLDRSITGDGLRKSFDVLSKYVPFDLTEIPSGHKVSDWTIPSEWKVKNAYIKDSNNSEILNYEKSNLHVVNYSTRLEGEFTFNDLDKYLYTNPKLPNAIPYVTSYYNSLAGFCIQYETYKSMKNQTYNVLIDSEHYPGSMTIGECILPGESDEEVLISSYMCHPSMGNNELSGPIVLSIIYDALKKQKNKYTYRFAIFPETIGAITYISQNIDIFKKRMNYGLVLTCLGGPIKKLSYKKSRLGLSGFDKFVQKEKIVEIRDFTPLNGSNERHFCYPTVDLPVGQFARTIYQEYPEYHTSLDNKEYVNTENLYKSGRDILDIINKYEKNNIEYKSSEMELERLLDNDGKIFVSATSKFGEPFLSKYNLYPKQNFDGTDKKSNRNETNDILSILSMSDGVTTLDYINEKLRLNREYFLDLINKLESNKLIKIRD